jgi:hypothetical protein
MPMGDHAAVEGRTAVRPDGAGGVVRRSTENCMTLISSLTILDVLPIIGSKCGLFMYIPEVD